MSMVKNNCIKWSMLELRGLLEDEDARVYFERTSKHFGLHPFQLNDLNRAIHEILSAKVNSYDFDLQGLMLAYKNPRLQGSLGGILHDSHFIHVDIEADFYIFRPEVGCTLKGIANKKASNHLGVLVHKAFNVSILKADDCEDWLGDYVFVGQEVKFTVTHWDFKGRLPFIRGELVADETMGQIFYESMENANIEEKPARICVEGGSSKVSGDRERKRSKKTKFVIENRDEDSDSSARTVQLDVKPVKKEKNRHRNNGESSNDRAAEELSPKKKKRVDKNIDRKNDVQDSETSSDHCDTMKKRVSGKKKLIGHIEKHHHNATSDSEDSSGDVTSPDSKRTKFMSPGAKKKLASKGASGNDESADGEPEVSADEKPRVFESMEKSPKSIESPSKSHGLDNSIRKKKTEKTTSHDDVLPSPKKNIKKNRISDSDEIEDIEIDVKPNVKVKKKKKKDTEEDTEQKKEKRNKSNERQEEEKAQGDEILKEKYRVKSEAEEDKKRNKKKSKPAIAEDERDEKNGKSESEEEKNAMKKKPKEEDHKIRKKIQDEDTADEGKKKIKNINRLEEGSVQEARTNEFEFIKPDLDVYEIPAAKCKRKRRRTITEAEEPSINPVKNEADDDDFFSDVRVKVEPDASDIEGSSSCKKDKKKKKRRSESSVDPAESEATSTNLFSGLRVKVEPDASDIEDCKTGKKSRKRKKSHSANEEEDEIHSESTIPRNVGVKHEPNISDVEDSKPSKKKSRRKNHEEVFSDHSKIKMESAASDLEQSSTLKRSFKSEPADTTKRNRGTNEEILR